MAYLGKRVFQDEKGDEREHFINQFIPLFTIAFFSSRASQGGKDKAFFLGIGIGGASGE